MHGRPSGQPDGCVVYADLTDRGVSDERTTGQTTSRRRADDCADDRKEGCADDQADALFTMTDANSERF